MNPLPLSDVMTSPDHAVEGDRKTVILQEIRTCQEVIRKKTEELKAELARQLDSACRMQALLYELGHKEV